jgi:hypothetical protein
VRKLRRKSFVRLAPVRNVEWLVTEAKIYLPFSGLHCKTFYRELGILTEGKQSVQLTSSFKERLKINTEYQNCFVSLTNPLPHIGYYNSTLALTSETSDLANKACQLQTMDS